jgi:hypothetical protein
LFVVLSAAYLPWQERVKRSIESFENDRDESRLQQLVIGKLFHWIRIRQGSAECGVSDPF